MGTVKIVIRSCCIPGLVVALGVLTSVGESNAYSATRVLTRRY
jgi:hypothetical protein